MSSAWESGLEAHAAAPRPGRRRAGAAFLAASTGLAAAVALLAPARQWEGYHLFADGRRLLGIPNACDTLSSAAFVAVGLAGVRRLLGGRMTFADPRERWPWLVLFAAVAATGAGSAFYHLAPDDGRLVWDRLPMAVGFGAMVAALLSERAGARLGLALLAPLALAGAASVVAWHLTGELRPYLFVQIGALAAVPLALALFPPAYGGSAGWLAALGLYALAKAAEAADAAIFALGEVVSGHTVKHLLAAAGVAALVRMLARRRRLGGEGRAAEAP